MRGPRAATDGAAAAVEELHLNPGLSSNLRQTSLSPLESPLAGHDARILVGIRVAHHHLLQQPARTSGPVCMMSQAGASHREFQEGTQHLRTPLKVFDRFQQRHHRQQTHHALGIQTQEPRLAGQDIHTQEVRQTPGHADDQCPKSIDSVNFQVLGQHPIGAQDRVGLRPCRGRGMQERSR